MTDEGARGKPWARLYVTIDPETKERLQLEAEELGIPLSKYIDLCAHYFQDCTEEPSREDGRGEETQDGQGR